MGPINIGPFALPAAPVLLLGALLVGTLTAKWLNRKGHTDVEWLLWGILLASVVAGRIAFVALYFNEYRATPWGILDIRDGGFFLPAGLAGAVAATAWLTVRRREARKSLLISTVVGVAFWTTGFAMTSFPHEEPMHMPDFALARVDGTLLPLDSLKGKPVVVNLWASWCPPCRREMPMLGAAQLRYPDVNFVFANQGELPETVRNYLAGQAFKLDNVLLDSEHRFGAALGSRALPTTLFFDAQGILIEQRMGELSAATLAQRLESLRQGR